MRALCLDRYIRQRTVDVAHIPHEQQPRRAIELPNPARKTSSLAPPRRPPNSEPLRVGERECGVVALAGLPGSAGKEPGLFEGCETLEREPLESVRLCEKSLYVFVRRGCRSL